MGQHGLSALGNSSDQRALILETAYRNGGNLQKTAHDLGIYRGSLYRIIYKLELWPLINRIRRERMALDDLIKRSDAAMTNSQQSDG